MKSNALRSRLFVIVVAVAFSLAAFKTISVFAQARRQPPPSDQKKNKRPPDTTDEKKQDPVPPDLIKTQDAEKVTIVTNIVNVDAVVYNKKSGGVVSRPQKKKIASFFDGAEKEN